MRNKTYILSFILILFLAFVVVAHAQATSTNYTLLEPLPLGDNGSVVTSITTKDFLTNLFQLVLAGAGVFAVFKLIVAGITYMTTDAFTKKEEAKGQIMETMSGLALVLGAWLIVATLLPANMKNGVLSFDVSLPVLQQTPNTNQPGTSGGVSGGLQQSTTIAIEGLKQECGCTVRITSTTGDSHDPNSLHYKGLAVDIGADANLTKYVTGQSANPQACSTYSKTLNGVSARFLWEPTGVGCGGAVASTGDHWHMSVQ